MDLQIDSVTPEWDKNYGKGYVGFTYHNHQIVSEGIAWFTRWARHSDICVSHALLVTGEDECIEAVGTGVRRGKLNDYFNDPHCQVFFRKPRGLNGDIAARLVATAEPEIGKAYDHALVASAAGAGSLLGRILNKSFGNIPDLLVSKLLNHDDQWICSELVAHCLDSQPEYRDKGILALPDETIDPQELFEDRVIFTPWHNTPPE